MHAVVLVGGFGTRLRPLTNTIPKPMLPIGNVPLITWLIRRLARGGVSEVTLALGFRPEPFRTAFPDGRCDDVRLHYAVEPEPLDTAGAIRFAADHTGIDTTFVVANGDVLTDLHVGELVEQHRHFGAAATIHLIGVEDPSAFGVVERDADGRILRFVEKPPPGEAPSNLVNAGTYVFEPAVLDLIPPGRRVSVERDTFVRLAEAGAIYGVEHEVYWLDAGRPEQYRRANLDLLDGRREDRCRPIADGASVAGDATVEHSVVGADSRVGGGARITGSVLLPGAVVGRGAVVVDSVLAGTVGAAARLERVVLGAEAAVDAGEVLHDVRRPDPDPPADPVATVTVPAAAPAPASANPGRPAPRGRPGPGDPALVIGGAGFLGSHLVDRLIGDAGNVDVVDDLSMGSLAWLAGARQAATRAHGSGTGELHIHTLAATAPELVDLVRLRRPGTVFHLAGLPGHEAAPDRFGGAFSAMLAVLEAARLGGVEKVVVALPATALYGHPAGRDLPVREGAVEPRGVRGVTARAMIDLLGAYRERWSIEFTALAVASVYGPRQRPGAGIVASALAAAAAGEPWTVSGDGRQTRDFVFVDDVVEALARAGTRGSGLVVNVGTGVQTSLRQLWALVAPEGPPLAPGPPRPDELVRFAVSPVRARIHLGWAPWTSLEEGLEATRAAAR